jgi:hypothetical protein
VQFQSQLVKLPSYLVTLGSLINFIAIEKLIWLAKDRTKNLKNSEHESGEKYPLPSHWIDSTVIGKCADGEGSCAINRYATDPPWPQSLCHKESFTSVEK